MNIDVLHKWLGIGASVAVMAGVMVAIGGLFVGIQTLKEAQATASATLVLKLRDTLDKDSYTKIANEIQDYNLMHPLQKKRGGKFSDDEIEMYLANFEDIGYLIDEKTIDSEMAFHHFSDDVEEAWCNADVQRVIQDERGKDKSAAAKVDPYFGKFQNLATEYLARERLSCKDLDDKRHSTGQVGSANP